MRRILRCEMDEFAACPHGPRQKLSKDETNGKGEPLVPIQNAIDQAGCFPSRNALVLMVRS
jgi:hypothetical protein